MNNHEVRLREIDDEVSLIHNNDLKIDYVEESLFHYKSCRDSISYCENRSLWFYYANLISMLGIKLIYLKKRKSKEGSCSHGTGHPTQLTF